MAIIRSLIDLDLYKITMLNAVILKYPDYRVKFKFNDRNNTKYPVGFDKLIIKEVQHLSKIKGITEDEANFLRKNVPWISEITIKYLLGYSFDPSEVAIFQNSDGTLNMNGEGYYHSLILWETILMSITSELYFKDIPVNLNQVRIDAEKKSMRFYMNNQRVVEMGTRRRRSYDVQDAVIRGLFSNGMNTMIGTSNVHFAMKYGLKVIGTVAHEWYMFHSALFGYKMANRMANDVWSDVYRGELGIGLPDTFTTDVFLKTFDTYHAKLFDGLRQDSGNPLVWAEKVVNHYKKLGINPLTKNYVFSDSIKSHEQLDNLHDSFKMPTSQKSYGIGTWLTNDFPEKALNIVIKLSEVFVNGEWVHVVKIGDDPGKGSGNYEEQVRCNMMLGLNKNKTLFD
jgi:nicotinate phosphoribosyltransferase